ncbi:MAG: hypothetical protein Q7U28_13860 [Aquabacterium sp.]|nr:hypothetical protein [Aquabacterium sp.]
MKLVGMLDSATAVAWQFTQSTLADLVLASRHPGLVALSARMEALLAFLSYLIDFGAKTPKAPAPGIARGIKVWQQ